MQQPGNHRVNLLPLLDVLLCTMGALIVILGIIARQVQMQGSEDAEAAVIVHEQLELQVEQLAAVREKTHSDLELARRRLSGIEDHSRQMKDQFRSLAQALENLERGDPAKDQERAALRQRLAQLNEERARLEAELETARSGAANRKPCYAIVPFDGVNQTSRRPIYIECRQDCIILQPEGIVLTATDFMGPPGPGNPLASALRAVREYWSTIPNPDGSAPDDPYPLLLVRPNGIIGYYLAREAMASWGAEFGYELIEGDWEIQYPAQPDSRLVEAQRRAVDEARQRLQWLAQASPESFGRRTKTQYRVSPIRGGVVRDGGPSLGSDPFADDPLGGFGKPGGSLAAAGSNARGNAAYGGAQAAGRYPVGGGYPTGDGYGTGPADLHATAGSFQGNGSAAFSSTGDGEGAPGTGSSGIGAGEAGEIASIGPRYAGQSEPGGSTAGQHGGMPHGETVADGSRNAGGGSSGQTSGAAAGQPGGDASAGQMGAASSADPSMLASGMPSPTLDMTRQYSRQRPTEQSVAASRGRNWAMPHTGSSVPITRPIRVACTHDRLVVLPDSADRQPQVIPLGERTSASVDQLVSAVHECARSWGIAGRGMYWKPQLVLEAAPGGVPRVDDLQALLADSGLEVKRK